MKLDWRYDGSNHLISPYSCIDALNYASSYWRKKREYKSITCILQQFLGDSEDIENDCTNTVLALVQVMGKLGFIFPEVEKGWGFTQSDLGPLDVITPAGWNLVRAETVAAMQECYLRAMVTPLFPCGDGTTFSPLCWTLAVLLELERRGFEPAVNFVEMAVVVQRTSPTDGLSDTVDKLCDLRLQRDAAERKQIFDKGIYDQGAERFGCKPGTFRDYADMNIRYLKATGMVQSRGKGIALVPEKHALAVELAKEITSTKPLLELYRSLCNGTPLPTDNATVANQVLSDLLQQIQHYGIAYSVVGKPLNSPAQINQARYEIEELIAEKKRRSTHPSKLNSGRRSLLTWICLPRVRKD